MVETRRQEPVTVTRNTTQYLQGQTNHARWGKRSPALTYVICSYQIRQAKRQVEVEVEVVVHESSQELSTSGQ